MLRILTTLLSFLICFKGTPMAQAAEEKYEVSILAGGCFWCLQPPFDHLDGVISTVVGYTGGHTDHPTYEETSSGKTGHYEAIKVTYDPSKVTFKEILDVFWQNIDPFDAKGQFCDKGSQYRAAVFYLTEEQKETALASKKKIESLLKQDSVIEVVPASPFYEAEAYHQNYYLKNPLRYKFYRYNCGRDKRLKEIYKK
ncbi:MAG: peptide-methionine (S)-S-oxide reductase MsrA [Alphaproteobacteria bacterium]|nr:peptide-methionine (S)-S-oxide reductase MsrA [Alphaproteobacteria bacterium]NCQ66829.1 peptide-methionine (S)-S-oxide reductase MsrA [Alphaproteobacteria bacterium]NCT07397.1 peptide-methionine (S)-S-oxide reductase MsrA [Alphaproteobacteria bacterium]